MKESKGWDKEVGVSKCPGTQNSNLLQRMTERDGGSSSWMLSSISLVAEPHFKTCITHFQLESLKASAFETWGENPCNHHMTESFRLEKTIKSKIWPITTLSTRPECWVPHPGTSWTPPGMVTTVFILTCSMRSRPWNRTKEKKVKGKKKTKLNYTSKSSTDEFLSPELAFLWQMLDYLVLYLFIVLEG